MPMPRFAAPLLLVPLLLHPLAAPGQDLGDPDCPRLMLVSSYTGNNVRIHDACDGSFIRNLDDGGRLAGPQGIAIDPAGNLVVASESNGRLVRYHRASLTYDSVVSGDRPETPGVEPAQVTTPTGIAIAADGRIFAGSYSGLVVITWYTYRP